MYMPKHFSDDAAAGLAAVTDYPFALLLTWDSDDAPPGASHLPMILDPEAPRPTLLGHVARANPHAQALTTERPALAVFSGPSAYISPNWYQTKRTGGQTVPTWNYVAVHVSGRIRPLPDADARRRVVDLLSRTFEGDGPGAWRLDDEPEDFVRRMVGGIVAFEMEVETVEAKAKLSQNRPAADQAGVLAGLDTIADAGAQGVAAAMRARGLGA